MDYPDFYTNEQKRISDKNHKLAIAHFKETGEWFKGCILHHTDETLRHNDPDRYIQWDLSDIIIVSRGEHNKIHFTGTHHSEETKKKQSESIKGEKSYMFGTHLSEEHKKKISDFHKSERGKERRERASKSCCKKVINIDTGEIFNSVKEASQKYGSISKCLTGSRNTAYGCHWEYYKEA